ncbi:nucleoside triphosphate pyrophosphohydrolase family protein [Bogoriella caseilytica]|uniref:Putative HAD superfamily Cof-like phosphohydrolase n=1 Tax=Bogoriella caseilytica TaxID=56055 RepID=A0A3N2B914_9MICO|nr:nucleoside triphosphate pyrophosphohydrolase family protein [Bogoriella caseilytica]ROR71747.1 putative HAD superfamily Cof-like phosphohydrolase [Bogoriella caseilytica]
MSSVSTPSPRDPEALVRQFHETYRLPVVDDAPEVSRERTHMRMALVAEEFAELVEAVYGKEAGSEVAAAYTRAVAADDGSRDTVETADALADLVYVIYGMALELGIPLADVLEEIQASNLSKLGEDGQPIYREDGKVLKGPGFFRPDVAGVLARHGHRPRS